jgi:AraC-like DNA-binding protein
MHDSEICMSSMKCVFSYALDVAAEFKCVDHNHDCCEIVYCSNCDGILIQDGRQYSYGDGSVFVYQPNGNHAVINRTAGRHVCIGISGHRVTDIPPGVWNAAESFGWLFERIASAATSDSPVKSERLDYLCGLVVVELLELTPSRRELPQSPASAAKALIDESFNTNIDVATIARQVYLSPDYLRFVFKKQVGQSVIAYIIDKRIEHAKQLLLNSAAPVHVVATECGFASPYYFSRVFKRLSGESPQEYRNRQSKLPK